MVGEVTRIRPVRPLNCAALAAVVLLVACRPSPPQLDAGGDSPPVPATSLVAPHVVALDPPQGAIGVDPKRTTLVAAFDRTMDRDGWAWVIENSATAPEIGESRWDESLRVNTAQVRLEPGRTYVLWLNAPQYLYFKDTSGTPLEPLRWTFTTAGAAVSAVPPVPMASSRGAVDLRPPQVVALEPPNGAVDVDPARVELRATFDREMEESWSWVTEGGDRFPELTGEAYFEPDRRTSVLPVRLEPGRIYVVWLNSGRYQLFRDLAGTPARPLRWTFTTRSAR